MELQNSVSYELRSLSSLGDKNILYFKESFMLTTLLLGLDAKTASFPAANPRERNGSLRTLTECNDICQKNVRKNTLRVCGQIPWQQLVNHRCCQESLQPP